MEIPFLDRGFRPFFLFGSIYAAVLIFAWVFIFQSTIEAPSTWSEPILWHGHEMIFGFTIAIIAGFLLTAVPNWTGSKPAKNVTLILLSSVWVLGRIGFWIPNTPEIILAIIDLAFIPLLAGTLAIPIFKSKQKRNFSFIGILTLLFIANLSMHLSALELIDIDPYLNSYIVVLLVMIIISIVSARVIPFFTAASLQRIGKNVERADQTKINLFATISLFALIFSVVFTELESYITAIVAFIASALHLWRMKNWHVLKSFFDPLLWILHLGHLWLALGIFALSLYSAGFIAEKSFALHILTIGCIGSMIIGMIARVSLGHTNRPLIIKPVIAFSFWLIQASIITRLLGFILNDIYYQNLVLASGVLWSLSFTIYAVVYFPILIAPEVKPRGLKIL